MIHYIDEEIENLKGKTCLLRVDLNIEEGEEDHSLRMKAVVPTIKKLIENNIKVVLLSHRGRHTIENRDIRPLSLGLLAEPLSGQLDERVEFLGDGNFDNLRVKTRDSNSKVMLVENLRWHREEVDNDDVFASQLAWLGDFYVNDAFSVCHRKHASVVAITEHLPSFGGLLLKKEIENLTGVMNDFKPPLAVIIGGIKIKNKMGVIDNFWNKADHFIFGGGIANTMLFAEGRYIGKSVYDEESMPFLRQYLGSEKVVLPVDFRVRNEIFLDIGEKTERLFREKILKSNTVIWNGPMGYIEEEEFAKGSYALAKSIIESKAFSVVGGGETTTVISKMDALDKFSFVSTGGGAMLEFLAGHELPGLKALDK